MSRTSEVVYWETAGTDDAPVLPWFRLEDDPRLFNPTEAQGMKLCGYLSSTCAVRCLSSSAALQLGERQQRLAGAMGQRGGVRGCKRRKERLDLLSV